MTFHRATQLQGVHLFSAKKLPIKLCLNGDTNGHACRPSVVLDLIHQQTGALKKQEVLKCNSDKERGSRENM